MTAAGWLKLRVAAWRTSDPGYRAVTAAYSLWMIFWVPVVLTSYGPANFLWLCNLSQFLFLYALWARDRLIASSQAGVLCIVGPVWTADFALGLITGGRTAVMTHYMWLDEIPLVARASSLYHVFLPVLAIWMLLRLGYDRRGPWLQCAICAAALGLTALFTAPYRNVNWLYAPFNIEQVWMPHWVYALFLLAAYPLLLFWPGHAIVLGILRLVGGGRTPARSSD